MSEPKPIADRIKTIASVITALLIIQGLVLGIFKLYGKVTDKFRTYDSNTKGIAEINQRMKSVAETIEARFQEIESTQAGLQGQLKTMQIKTFGLEKSMRMERAEKAKPETKPKKYIIF